MYFYEQLYGRDCAFLLKHLWVSFNLWAWHGRSDVGLREWLGEYSELGFEKVSKDDDFFFLLNI